MDKVFPFCIVGLAGFAALVYMGMGNWKMFSFYLLTALINWVMTW